MQWLRQFWDNQSTDLSKSLKICNVSFYLVEHKEDQIFKTEELFSLNRYSKLEKKKSYELRFLCTDLLIIPREKRKIYLKIDS